MRALFVKSAGIAQAMRALSRSALVALLLKLKPKTRFTVSHFLSFFFSLHANQNFFSSSVAGPPSTTIANFFSSVHHHRFVSVSSPSLLQKRVISGLGFV